MHQIGADGVPPVHRPPECAMGIELIKQMIFTLPMDQAVGVVEPALGCCEVVAWQMGVVGELITWVHYYPLI